MVSISKTISISKTVSISLTNNEQILHNVIMNKDKTIDELKRENDTLKNNELTQKIDYLANKDKLIEALSKLNDCDKLSNDVFKSEYRKYFNLDDYDNNVPNLGQFVNKPPLETTNKQKYDFWKTFCAQYPNSDNSVYNKLNSSLIKL